MKVFADPFYLIAVTDSTDNAHERARRITDEIVTRDEVLAEYLTFFCAAPEHIRSEVALTVEDLLQDPAVKVIPQSRESFIAGLTLYRARPDKGYSLTDCVSMAAMRRKGLSEALTHDRHFEQEGFAVSSVSRSGPRTAIW